MHIYLLIHSIHSSVSKRKLENHLSSLANILSFEVEKGCYSYEFQTNIHKKELIRLLGSFILKLPLKSNDRVLLYDSRIVSGLLEKPHNGEKIILYGDAEREKIIEDTMRDLFKAFNRILILEKVQNGYFSFLLENQ